MIVNIVASFGGRTFDIPVTFGTWPSMSGGGHGGLEPPNAISLLHHFFPGSPWIEFVVKYENIFFAAFAATLISVVFVAGSRTLALVPGRFQNFVEIVVETLEDFFANILGPHGRSYVPYIASLFLYIFCMNMMGLVPFLKSSTTDLNTTLALATCTFITVQVTALTKLGPKTYLDHLAGQPRDMIMYILAPFLFCLFLILDVLVPPITLSLRLFGNITGGDTLLAAFQNMAMTNLFHPTGALSLLGGVMAFLTVIIISMLLVLLDTIQALVFSLLSTIYILMVLPHEEHAH